MNELDFNKDDLSIPAREALSAVDAYIDTMNSLYGRGSVKKITLHHECYDDLSRSIKYHTEDSQSIAGPHIPGCGVCARHTDRIA